MSPKNSPQTNYDKAINTKLSYFQEYFDRLTSMCLTLFEWSGLPETMNARFLEYTLFTDGRACFVNDKNRGLINVRCTPAQELNIYNECYRYTAYSNDYTEQLTTDNLVLVRNNWLEKPSSFTMKIFANRIAEIAQTIDININGQRTPFIIACDQKQLLTVKNLYMKYEAGVPIIYGDKSLDLESIKVFPTVAPFMADKLNAQREALWNEVLTFIGLNNANNEKKERLLYDEVNANNELIGINASIMLLTRQEACEKANKLFGTNISVKFRADEQSEGDIENEYLHNNIEQSR